MNLSQQQQEVFDLIKSRRCKFVRLDGSAGTGKSYLIDQIRQYDRSVCIVAPTGRAASNVRGETLYRMFGVPSEQPLDPDERVTVLRTMQIETRFFGRKRDRLLQGISWIVIEEYTMVRCDHIDFIDKAMRRATGNPEAFGGKHVLFVGGPGQLLPVADEKDTKSLLGYDYPPPFGLEQSRFWRDNVNHIRVCSLNHIFRQSNPIEANVLERIKVGSQTDMDLRLINSRVGKPHNSAIILTPYRNRAAQINEDRLSVLSSREYVFEGTQKGDIDEVKSMDRTLRLREGCRVIIKKNIRKKIRGEMQHVVNGDTGTFVGMDKYQRLAIIRDSDSDYVYIGQEKESKFKHEIDEHGNIESKEVAYFKQYPVRLGYAMTIHSSQGLTLRRVHLELPGHVMKDWFGLLYVAVSRVTSLSGLTISRPLTHGDISSTIADFKQPQQQYEFK